MEKFKRTVRMRVTVGGLFCCLVAALTTALRYFDINTTGSEFTVGFAVGIEIVVFFYTIKSYKALQNEEKLKSMYIEENDERKMMIKAKSGATAMKFVVMGISLAMLVSAHFNLMVLYTLMAVVFFLGLVFLGTKIYYNKKI